MRAAICNFLCASINETESDWRLHFDEIYHEHADSVYLNVFEYLGFAPIPGVYFPEKVLWQ